MSGNLIASLYPIGHPTSSHLDIRNLSGSTSLTLNPNVPNPRTILRALSADLRGGSGAFRVRFPSSWEGEVVSHLSGGPGGRGGGIRHEWEGLRVLREGHLFRAVNGNGGAGRGEGGKQLNISGSSMNVELVGVRVPEEDEGDEDDDWTVVGDENLNREAARRPPPSYEDAIGSSDLNSRRI